MLVVFVGLALILITLVTVLVYLLDEPPPPVRSPSVRKRRPRIFPLPPSRTNPFGAAQRDDTMILSRRVLVDLPLPPPSERDTVVELVIDD